MSFDAMAYLASLIDDTLRDLESAPDEFTKTAALASVSRVRGATEALRAISAIDPRSASSVLDQFDETLIERGLLRRVHLQASAGAPAGNRAPMAMAGIPEFLRVIVLGHESDRVLPGHTARFVSLDVWSNHLQLRSAIAPPLSREERQAAGRRGRVSQDWVCVDDVGSPYQSTGRSWDAVTETIRFQPGLRSGATVLQIRALAGDGTSLAELDVPLQ